MGFNAFSDMTVAELEAKLFSSKLRVPKKSRLESILDIVWHNPFKPAPPVEPSAPISTPLVVPIHGLEETSVDWLKANVYTNKNIDQGACGSCWAFTTVTTMEALYSINYQSQKPAEFSVQYLLDCDTTNYGCDGGWMTDAYLWTIDNGIVSWNDYPSSYTMKSSKCKPTNGKTKFYNVGANEVESPSNDQLKAIIRQGPAGAAFYSDLNCMNHYKSGTLSASDCNSTCSDPTKKEVNHAVTIVGFGKSERKDCEEYWLIKNSWGTTWGEQGHFKWCADRKEKTEEFGGCQIASFIMFPSMQ